MHETEVRNWACLHAPAAITTLTQYGIAMFSAAVPAFWRQSGLVEALWKGAPWRQSVLAEHEEYGKLLYVQDLG